MGNRSWKCEKLGSGYLVTKENVLGYGERQEAEEKATGVVQNLIAWLGITKYQLVKEEEK